MGLIVGRDGDGHIKTIGISCLRQQILRLGGIVLIVVHQLGHEVALQLGVDAAAHSCTVSVRDHVHDHLTVDGVADGLTHLHIIKRFHSVVEIHGLHQIHGVLQNGELVAELGRLSRGQVGAHVHAAALEGHHKGRGILVDAVSHLLHTCGLAPILVKALQHDALLRGTLRQHEGACTGFVRGHGIGVCGDNGSGHEVDKLHVGLLKTEGNRLFIDCLQVTDSRKRRHKGRVTRVVGAASQRVNHILRRYGFTIVELYTLTKREGIDKSIFRNLVAFCHSGDQFTGRASFHQALIDVE